MKKLLFTFTSTLAVLAIAFSSCSKSKNEAFVAVTDVKLNLYNTSLTAGSTLQLIATVEPSTATNQNVTWSSNNTARATVSASGLVTIPAAATAGEVTIVVKTADGSKEASCAITIITGNGTASSPYLITSAAALQNIGTGDLTLDKHYCQTANINMSGQWTPIGTDALHFTGSYDGGGFSITNLSINATTDNQGLFWIIGVGGAVRNMALRDANVTSTNRYIGGIAGTNYGTIENCYVTGAVKGGGNVGGVAGNNDGVIKNCYTTCTVTGSGVTGNSIGGLAGGNFGTVEVCYATGKITNAANAVGGIVGDNWDSGTVVQHCVALNNEVSATQATTTAVGRIVGFNGGGALINNLSRAAGMILKNGSGSVTPTPDNTSSKHGASVPAASTHGAECVDFWSVGLGTDNIKYWSLAVNRLPHLKTTEGAAFNQTQNPTVVN